MDMTITKTGTAVVDVSAEGLGKLGTRLRALASLFGKLFAGDSPIKLALYDGYVGSYAEFYRNWYAHDSWHAGQCRSGADGEARRTTGT